jgi:uncharacterized protein GlcG (DUF336 family)
MSFARDLLAGFGLALLLSGTASAQSGAAPSAVAQGLITQRSMSLAMARTIAEAALSECKSRGYNTAVAVVDRGGQLLVLLRDEQAAPQAGQRNLADILALSGGVPIQLGKETIGGVGSTGSTLEVDDACSRAGIAKVADLLK